MKNVVSANVPSLVGTPFSYETDGSNKMSLMTTGVLAAAVAWAIDAQGNILVPPTAANDNQLYKSVHRVWFSFCLLRIHLFYIVWREEPSLC